MKKCLFILILSVLAFIPQISTCQTSPTSTVELLTPSGAFDNVHDRFGNRYALANLKVGSGKTIGGGTVTSVPAATCSSGYFDLYFEPGSLWATNTAFQSVICQVCKDISDFIISPMTNTLVNTTNFKINVYCDNTFGALADASQFYVFPYNPVNPNQGIVQGQVYKSIMSGTDPYLNIPMTFSNSAKFYHGRIGLNPSAVFSWNTNMTTVSTGIAYDAYSIMLHEVGHLLGFGGLINYGGYSIFGPNNNMFEKYDQFLYDASGNPLLSSSTPSCNNSNITYAAPLSAVAPSSCATPGVFTNAMSCVTAAQYSSTTTNVKVVTPDCFQLGSSLVHFDDMCSTPTFTPTNPFPLCTPNPPTPGAKLLYFVMSAGSVTTTSNWTCNHKRYFKEEERRVFCDIGYSTKDTYSSTPGNLIDGNLLWHIYPSGSCTSIPIVGINDGVVNNNYTYTTTGTSYSVPLASLLANDSPSTGLTVSCVEAIYTNSITNVAAAISGTDLVVTASAGSGLAIIKYLPKDGSGNFGNPTYVFVYFISNNCNPTNACNMVQNGGFENLISNTMTPQCGVVGVDLPFNAVSCWEPVGNNPSLFTRSCSTNTVYDLGNNTTGSSPHIINSFNGTGYGNDRVIGLNYQFGSTSSQAIKNNLGSPLVPGGVYDLSFMINNSPSQDPGNNTGSVTAVITVASATTFAFPYSSIYPGGNVNIIQQFTVPASTAWQHVTHTFTFTSPGSLNHSALLIGIDWQQTQVDYALANGVWCYLDEIALTAAPHPSFVVSPKTICGNQSYTNLDQYATVAGTFTGQAVTFSNGQYNFNLNSTLPPGNYPIAYTYTTGGCVHTQYQMITINTNTNLLVLNPADFCLPTSTLNLGSLITNTNFIVGTNFSVNGSTTNPIYTFGAPGQYIVSALNTSTALCAVFPYTTAVNVHSVYPTPSIFNGTTSVSTTDLCIGASFSVSATSSASLFSWMPGSLTGSMQALSPTVTTIYTLSVYDHSTCASSQTLAIQVFTNCCNFVIVPTFTSSLISGNIAPGFPILVTQNCTVQSGGALSFLGEALMMPNVKITVESGGSVVLGGAYLRACKDDMWQGIEIQDGGQFSAHNTGSGDNLVEDALTAVDVLPQSTTAISPIIAISNTTFNKNYIGVRIGNYDKAVSPYPFVIYNSVFTSRDFNLPVNASSWPQTGIATAADLKYAFTSTTGLTPPYLQQSTYTITNLRNPHATQPSHIAIKLDNVGVATTTNLYGITIGDNSSASSFNLFDAHGQFISSVNSNVTSLNNVFQNTRTYTTATGNFGGAAISHSTSGTLNTALFMTSSSKDIGNRFWNCHRGIEGKNIYRMTVTNAIFRSNQNTANPAFTAKGIEINTNRFEYVIQENEFSNLEKGINIPLAAGVFSLPPGYTLPSGVYVVPGVYADRMLITQNEFNGNTGGGTYMNDAITVSAVNSTPLFPVTSTSLDPVSNALSIVANILTEVHRGINVSGLYSFPIKIASNQIVLNDNASVQHAIKLTNNNPTVVGIGGFGYGKSIVAQNTASFSSTSFSSSPNNSVTALVHCGHNGYAFLSPSVTCNSLAQGPQGFVFDGSNKGTIWAGNDMEPMPRGMVLGNNGKIGQQGSSTTASANNWKNTWAGANYNTYVDAASEASLSILYVDLNTGSIPSNNFGPVAIQSYLKSGNIIASATPGSYNCNDMPNYKTISVPNNDDSFLSTEVYYMEQQDFYYLLHVNDSIRYSDPDFESFYDTYKDLSIGILVQAEELLAQSDYNSARDLLAELDLVDPNAVELNYLAFYEIYANYLENSGLSEDDKAALFGLAMLCPGKQGSCVYQARALYNTIYHEVLNPACEIDGGDRRMFNEAGKFLTQQSKIRIFPNPTQGKLTIETNKENEEFKIEIRDLSNRLVYKAQVKATIFFANLELNLLNGAYLIRVEQANGNAITKKLLIAK